MLSALSMFPIALHKQTVLCVNAAAHQRALEKNSPTHLPFPEWHYDEEESDFCVAGRPTPGLFHANEYDPENNYSYRDAPIKHGK